MTAPPKWVNVPANELGKWHGGNTPSMAQSSFWGDSGMPWVSSKDVREHRVGDTDDHLTLAGVAASRGLTPKGSVVVVVRSGILERFLPVSVTSREVAINQDLKAVKPHSFVMPDFLRYYLQSAGQEILHACSKEGTTVRSIEWPRFEKWLVPIAPLAEQRRIVEAIEAHFTQLDAAVAALLRVRTNLRRYRASVLKAACVGSLLESETSSWREEQLENVAELVTGTTPPTTNQSSYGGPHPFYKPRDLDAGYYVHEAESSLSDYGLAQVRPIASMSVMVTCIGATIGKTGLCRAAGATNQQITSIVPKHSVLDARWAFWYVVSPLGQRWILKESSSTTLPILNKGKMRTMPVIVPPLNEQDAIVAEIERRLSVADALAAEVEAGLKRSSRLRQAILKKAFEGRLVAQDLNDAPVVLQETVQKIAKRGKRRSAKSKSATIQSGDSRRYQILKILATCPRQEGTFDTLRGRIGASFEQLQGDVFQLLADGMLVQVYNEEHKEIRFRAVRP